MQSDPSLHDEQLEAEIKLVSDLVLAASHSEERLPQQAIDEILGVDVQPPAVAGSESSGGEQESTCTGTGEPSPNGSGERSPNGSARPAGG